MITSMMMVPDVMLPEPPYIPIYPTNTIRSFWKLDGNPYDYIGTNHGTPTDISWGDGTYAQFTSSVVNGTDNVGNSKIDIPDNDSLSFPSVPFTWSTMVWFDTLPPIGGSSRGMMLFNKIGPNTIGNREYYFYYLNNEVKVLYFDKDSGTWWGPTYGFEFETGSWNTIIVSIDGEPTPTSDLYINGVKMATDISLSSYSLGNSTYKATMGAHSQDTNQHTLNGRLKQMGLWEAYFTDEQAMALHNDMISGRDIVSNIYGPEIITNGNFDSNIDGWTRQYGGGTSTAIWDSGQALFNQGGSPSARGWGQTISIEEGKIYRIQVSCGVGHVDLTKRMAIWIGSGVGDASYFNQDYIKQDGNLQTFYFTSPTTNPSAIFQFVCYNVELWVDNVSMRETNVYGGNIITNGTFDTDVSGWTGGYPSGTGIYEWDTGMAKINPSASGVNGIAQYIPLVAGVGYRLKFRYIDVPGTGSSKRLAVWVSNAMNTASYVKFDRSNYTITEDMEFYWTQSTTNASAIINFLSYGVTTWIDNVSLEKVY